MQFLDNKYTKCYFNIIYKATDIKIINETEHHHVLPRSLFPEYTALSEHPWNGVHLTHREHFICHWLLTKMVLNKSKYSMLNALSMMKANKRNLRYQSKITARVFAKIKEELNIRKSIQTTKQWANKSQEEIDTIFAKRKVTWENKPQEEKDLLRKTLSEENKIKWGNKSPGEKEIHAQRSKDQASNRSTIEQQDLSEKHSKIWAYRSEEEKDAITNKRIITHNNKSSKEKSKIKQKRQQTRDEWNDESKLKFSNKMKEIAVNRNSNINKKIASSLSKQKWHNNGSINTRCIPGTEPAGFTLGRLWKRNE